MERLVSLFGLIVFTLIAWLLSTNRNKISKRIIIWGIGLQFITALLVIGIPALGIPAPLGFLFSLLNDIVVKVLAFGDEGAKFLFGSLLDTQKMGVIFAFRVLPSIIFFSCLMAILYYFGVLQKIVFGLAWVMKRSLGTSGPETLSAAGNIFLGQTEAPLLIKPYLKHMTNSELLCVMIGGMANVAGGVLAAYVMMLQDKVPNIAGHLITVSVMSAPASLLISKLLMPETKSADQSLNIDIDLKDANVVDAATRGASEGLLLALNVGAMLIAFVGVVALLNGALEYGFSLVGLQMSLQKYLAFFLCP